MASRYVSRVTVYEPEIASLFQSGGQVNTEASKITALTKAGAIAMAPVGKSGRLKEAHRSRVVPSGRYGVRGYVENNSSHAHFVHDGTTGPIRSTRGSSSRWMGGGAMLGPLPFTSRYSRGAKAKPIFAPSVKGQDANPWLRRAAQAVLLRYGVAVTPRYGFRDQRF